VDRLTSGRDGDRLYYAMEYVDGADLSAVARVMRDWRKAGASFTGDHLAAAMSHVSSIRHP